MLVSASTVLVFLFKIIPLSTYLIAKKSGTNLARLILRVKFLLHSQRCIPEVVRRDELVRHVHAGGMHGVPRHHAVEAVVCLHDFHLSEDVVCVGVVAEEKD